MKLSNLFKNESAFYKPDLEQSYLSEGLKSLIYALLVPLPHVKLDQMQVCESILRPLVTWLKNIKKADYIERLALTRRFAFTSWLIETGQPEDMELLVLLSEASRRYPFNEDTAYVYFYVFRQFFNKQADAINLPKVEKLTPNQQKILNILKERLFQEQMKFVNTIHKALNSVRQKEKSHSQTQKIQTTLTHFF